MNEDQRRNLFLGGLTDLIRDIKDIVESEGRDPYAGDGERTPHEHDTRSLFIDRLLSLLGWRLGAHGNVMEESRLKGDTTRFMDYVGVVEETHTPLMILEAKAWDKPYISARISGGRHTDEDLLVSAIRHILDSKPADSSPVIKEWHKYLVQVCGYVKTLKERHAHDTSRVVLASGPWLVVFTKPVTTFVQGIVSPDHFVIFRMDDYVARAEQLYNLLHRSMLTQDVPFPLRPAQLPQYLELSSVAATFHGLHIHYEETGSTFLGPRPRLLAYPVLIIERDDGVLITVVSNQDGFPLIYTNVTGTTEDEEDHYTLDLHLAEVQEAALELLTSCGTELGGALEIKPLPLFQGFQSLPTRLPSTGVRMVTLLKSRRDEWLLATGTATHYLTAFPRTDPCQFHTWMACHSAGHGIGSSALNAPSVNPRAIFIDTQPHHCAHQVVQDRRTARCHIMGIDQRTCCQACIYAELCWRPDELNDLPCGS